VSDCAVSTSVSELVDSVTSTWARDHCSAGQGQPDCVAAHEPSGQRSGVAPVQGSVHEDAQEPSAQDVVPEGQGH
jgi:hypothetical protein